MPRGWRIAIGVVVALIVVACIGLAVLRWGQMVYWRSGGQRGWSLGEWAYELFGWGREAYRSGFGQIPPAGPRGFWGPGRPGGWFGPGIGMARFWPVRLLGGLFCLGGLALLAGLGMVLGQVWRRRRCAPPKPTQATPPAPPETGADG